MISTPTHTASGVFARSLPVNARTEARLLDLIPAQVCEVEARRLLRRWARRRGHETACSDIGALLAIEVEEAALGSILSLELEVHGVASNIAASGIPIDLPAWSELLRRRRENLVRVEAILRREYGLSKPHDSNACAAVGRRHGLDLVSADKAELMLQREHPFAAALMEYRTEQAFTADVGPKVLAAAREDWRARCLLDPLGTDSGRFTASSPNLLGLEKRSDVRRCIRAPDGRALMSADYAQMDLRVLTVIACDGQLQRYFREGADVHTKTAAAVMKVDERHVTPEQRQAGKALGFALVYGAGSDGIMEYAAKNFGILLSIDEAVALRREFLAHYRGVAQWQRSQEESGSCECRSILGRRRLVEVHEIPTKLNSPVAMTSADIFKIALVQVHRALRGTDAFIVLPIHDEILVEAPTSSADEVAALVRGAMEEAMRSVLGKAVPARVEITVGESWAE